MRLLQLFSIFVRVKRLKLITVLLALCLSAAAQERNAALIFLQFKDLKFKYSYPEFDALADSLTIYFNDQFHSNPVFSFTRGPVVTLDRAYAEYGANTSSYNDDHMYLAAIDACYAAADSLNFADFAGASGSEIRDVLILVPGKSELDTADRNLFRPQYVEFESRNSYPRIGGRRLICYALASELDAGGNFTGIGNLAHEYSHTLGLQDYYDTDNEGSGGLYRPLWGQVCLMNKGNEKGGGHLPPNWCAPDYYSIGAGNGIQIDTAGTYSLEPISRSGTYFIFKGASEGEVFLAESRVAEGWDAGIGGSGMVIYHFDRSSGNALWSDWDGRNLTAVERWQRNRLNCNPAHLCVQLEAPDSAYAFFPFGDADGFSSETEPPFRFWDGTDSPLAISGIRQAPDGTVSFKLSRPISGLKVTPFQNSVIIKWKCDPDISDIEKCLVRCVEGTDTLSVIEVAKGTGEDWTCLLEDLSPASAYKISVQIIRDGKPFFTGRISAATLSMRKGVFPFIYLKGVERNPDGSFRRGSKIPLQVFNVSDAAEIHWYFDGAPVSPSDGGYYTLQTSGALKAEVIRLDGSREIIIKEIVIR